VFTRINITPTFLSKKIEDQLIVADFASFREALVAASLRWSCRL